MMFIQSLNETRVSEEKKDNKKAILEIMNIFGF